MATNEQIHAALCSPGQFFEVETLDIRGVPTRTWKSAPRNLGALLTRGAATAGPRDFLVLDDERITHERHLQLVERFAASLIELGVRKGDRVAIAMRNLPEWSIAFFGATMAGAIAVPVNAFGTGAELGFAIADADARVVVADGERLERLAIEPAALADRTVIGTRLDDRKGRNDLPPGVVPFAPLIDHPMEAPIVDIDPDDPATIFYTSGTSARPKGVLGTHRNICTNLVSMMFSAARSALRDGSAPAPGDPPVLLLSVPLFHATGSHSMLVGQAFFGGTLIFMRRWDPEVALDLIEREWVTSFSGVPTMLWDVLNSPTLDRRDLSSVRNLGGGGSASPPELLRRIRDRFPECGAGTGYGLTETSSITSSIGGNDYLARPDSVGAPVAVCEVRIVDENGNDAPSGNAGEIWIKGANVVPGYWRRPEETAAAFTDGWLHSGDIGRLDEEGFLYIVDRAKDIVIRGGENISTLEVESVLFEHPAVLEAAVFATPHATLGEEVAAVVRLQPGSSVTAEELRAHATLRLAPYKVPTHVWLTGDALQRGATGKLLKRAIQAEYAPLARRAVTVGGTTEMEWTSAGGSSRRDTMWTAGRCFGPTGASRSTRTGRPCEWVTCSRCPNRPRPSTKDRSRALPWRAAPVRSRSTGSSCDPPEIGCWIRRPRPRGGRRSTWWCEGISRSWSATTSRCSDLATCSSLAGNPTRCGRLRARRRACSSSARLQILGRYRRWRRWCAAPADRRRASDVSSRGPTPLAGRASCRTGTRPSCS